MARRHVVIPRWSGAVHCALVLVMLVPRLTAQAPALDLQITQAIAGMTSPDWQTRERAFVRLLTLVPSERGSWWVPPAVAAVLAAAPARADDIKVAVIRLLEKQDRNAVTGESYSEFMAGLIGAVAEFHDPRGAHALASNVDSGGMATRGLAALGRDAVDAVIAVMNDPTKRIGATRALSQMLDPAISTPSRLDPPAADRIKRALFGAARDDSFWVRVSAVDGLERIPGGDVTALLTELAENDPYSRPGASGGTATYFVRDRAREALARRAADGGRPRP